jgi:DNA-binding beta-propeller fold protein YncE
VLRQVDRFLAPVVWAAAALTVVLLLAGPALIGAKADKTATAGSTAAAAPDGKALFASNCGSCHTLARADATGSVGPNLDDLKPDAATVKATVRSGKGTMPAFEDTLSAAEIDAVAAFVAGEEPAAATPEATATPERGEVTTAETAPGPDGITVANGRAWVTNASAGSLQRFDAATGRAQGKPLAVGRQPDNPVVAGGDVWVALGGDDAVARVDGSRVTRIPVGDAPEDLAAAGGIIWVTNAGDGTVTRIDGGSGRVIGPPIRVGGRPLGIAASGDTVWVSSFDDGTVWRLSAGTGAQRGQPIRVGSKPRGVAAGGGTAWVANSGGDSVTRLRDRKTVRVGDNPRDLAVSGGSVWVANAGDDTLTRLDAASGEPVGDPTKVGDDPTGVAVGGGAAWATGFRDDTLSRVPIAP